MTGTLVRVSTSYFVCGLIFHESHCVEAAPIMKWAIGKHIDQIRGWRKIQQWEVL